MARACWCGLPASHVEDPETFPHAAALAAAPTPEPERCQMPGCEYADHGYRPGTPACDCGGPTSLHGHSWTCAARGDRAPTPERAGAEVEDAALIDLWWTVAGDNWAVPEDVMVRFGRAAAGLLTPPTSREEWGAQPSNGGQPVIGPSRDEAEHVARHPGDPWTLVRRTVTPWVPVETGGEER